MEKYQQNTPKMKYCIARFVTRKTEKCSELMAQPDIIYKRHLKSEITYVLNQVCERAKKKGFAIVERSAGNYFICEDKSRRLMFAIMEYKPGMKLSQDVF